MSRIYLVIGSDMDGAFIDDDCIFYNKEDSIKKIEELSKNFHSDSIIFTLYDIKIDKEKLEDD